MSEFMGLILGKYEAKVTYIFLIPNLDLISTEERALGHLVSSWQKFDRELRGKIGCICKVSSMPLRIVVVSFIPRAISLARVVHTGSQLWHHVEFCKGKDVIKINI